MRYRKEVEKVIKRTEDFYDCDICGKKEIDFYEECHVCGKYGGWCCLEAYYIGMGTCADYYESPDFDDEDCSTSAPDFYICINHIEDYKKYEKEKLKLWNDYFGAINK